MPSLKSQLYGGVLVVAVMLGYGCRGMTSPYNEHPGLAAHLLHVIHPNDIKPLSLHDYEYLQAYHQGINASVLIMLELDEGRRFCSGFIFEKRGSEVEILSNHHCFSQYGVAGAAELDLIAGACGRTKVFFNAIQGAQGNLAVAECVEGTLDTDHRADIASFRARSISGPLPKAVTHLNIASPESTDFSQDAYIIHYPIDVAHVLYEGTTVPGTTITESDCQIIGEYVATEEWESNPVLAMSFKHTCDLSQGSSGSALIAKDTHEVLGLNWGGVKTIKKQGSSNQETDVSNAAIKPSCIYGYLYDRDNLEGCVSDPLFSRSFASSDSSVQPEKTDGVAVDRWVGCAAIAHPSFAGAGAKHQERGWIFILIWLPAILVLYHRRLAGQRPEHHHR